MTSKERVQAAFDFREADRVPCWLGASPEFIHKAIAELKFNNEEELRRETQRTIDIMRTSGGFIAGTSHDYLLEETPVENVHTMFETIKSYR